jgi:hypothetical protein
VYKNTSIVDYFTLMTIMSTNLSNEVYINSGKLACNLNLKFNNKWLCEIIAI